MKKKPFQKNQNRKKGNGISFGPNSNKIEKTSREMVAFLTEQGSRVFC